MQYVRTVFMISGENIRRAFAPSSRTMTDLDKDLDLYESRTCFSGTLDTELHNARVFQDVARVVTCRAKHSVDSVIHLFRHCYHPDKRLFLGGCERLAFLEIEKHDVRCAVLCDGRSERLLERCVRVRVCGDGHTRL